MTLSWFQIFRLGFVQMALGACALPNFSQSYALGLAASIVAYALIGLGVGASGTSLLALLATTTAPHRRAAAATITWLMMIFGIAATAGTVGQFIDPYSPALLVKIVRIVVSIATLVTCFAIWRVERNLIALREPDPTPFRDGLKEVWRERRARNFTIFVFLSMTAYFMQELILEPYAGLVFGFTPGQSTSLSGAQNGGAFVGMVDLLRLSMSDTQAFGIVFIAEAALFIAAAAMAAKIMDRKMPSITLVPGE